MIRSKRVWKSENSIRLKSRTRLKLRKKWDNRGDITGDGKILYRKLKKKKLRKRVEGFLNRRCINH